jgi:hypothetical protein
VSDRRAERLVRWYPQGWRGRYGEEFVQLLVADIEERPRSWRRAVDVAGSGLLARLTSAGLMGPVLGTVDQVRAGLATLGCAAAVFLAFGVAMWAQLTVGWQWSPPTTTATSVAMVVMSCGALVLFGLGVLASAPIGWAMLRAAAGRRFTDLVRPCALALAGLVVLVVGGRHFANGWPGTGGHHWAHQGLVPGGLAAFMWSSTLSVSSYWAHPAALLSFPTTEIVWMLASPLAMVCLMAGAAKMVRRLELSPRILRYEGFVARVAALFELVFLLGSCDWIVAGGPGPRNLFHAGAVDVLGLAVLATALVVGHRATRRARCGLATRAHQPLCEQSL